MKNQLYGFGGLSFINDPQKDRDFYNRIKRHRVDPSSQSYSNPVPDYYGEKIGSVKEFRNWMKDQRAYNKKRQNFL
jgi:import inner membrane translocase subunit TIM23